ncbi:MAG: ABC transporter permease [Propionibacteriaceae bacterium]|nr:ABC transporter permease [Propionibacteriaceae bacterium]
MTSQSLVNHRAPRVTARPHAVATVGQRPRPAPIAPPVRRSGRSSAWLTIVAPVVLGILVLSGWFASTTPGAVPRTMVPTPMAVWHSLYQGLFVYADMWPYIGSTLEEALVGCLVGLVVAVPLAVIIYRSRIVSAAVLPFLGATQAIPAIALAPLLVLWVGYGLGGIVTLCALMVFFPILVSSVVGFRHIDKDVISAAQVDGAGSLALLINIEIPLAMHSILAGVRNGFTLSITGAVVGEMVMGGSGLGTLVTVQRNSNDLPGMFSTILILALCATIIYSLVSIAERRWSNLAVPLPKGSS